MKDKKGKALVMKLLDDLIGEGEAGEDTPPPKGEKSSDPTQVKGPRVSHTSEDLILSLGDEPSSAKTTTQTVDKTIRLSETQAQATKPPQTQSNIDATTGTIKSSVGKAAPLRSGGFASSTEAALASSENLRIAQTRILELEEELERVRVENEQLAAAGETLRRRADDMASRVTNLEEKLAQISEAAEQEVESLRRSLNHKEKEAKQIRLKLEESDLRISSNIKKIRVRERELENRLELAKMESTALVRNKDEIILDLKRQIDQLTIELDNYRNKGQELHRLLSEKQELVRRTVKALRIALSMLEGEEASSDPAAGALRKVRSS